MLSFKQFLAELEDLEGNQLDEIQAQIQEHCQPFLNEAAGNPLYRGLKSKDERWGAYHTAFVRKDRRPLTTGELTSKAFDDWFNERYGYRIRSAGLFVSGQYGEANFYGHPHYVFPMGDFKYCWAEWSKFAAEGDYPRSGVVEDSLAISSRIGDTFQRMRTDGGKPDRKEVVDHVLDKEIDWHFDNLPKAISQRAEIILFCDRVILVPVPNRILAAEFYEKLIQP